jgi:HD-GYP domain-containing protein (c-di-GMP phosphodiesterase class II)
MVSVAKGDRTFGWLLGINHRRQPRSAQADPLWDLSQFEFGSVEAGVFGAVATMLATHAHNAELFREKEALLLGIVRAMVSAIDAKDPYTCGHSERVALVGQFLGKQLGLPEEQCEHIYLAGLLHDLGKLGVPDAILRKPGPLNNDEANELRVHPERGWAILQDLDQLKHLVPGILCHHERYDGKGYPDGLAGEAIPLTARVLAVADSYDAMVSDRPYRKGMPHEKVESILREGSGTQWDPQVIDALFRNLAEIKALWNTHQPHVPRLRQPKGERTKQASRTATEEREMNNGK